MPNLYNVPTQNAVQRTLANTLNAGEVLTITFATSVSSVLQASTSIPGILVVDRVDSNGNLTPSLTEYISFTGVSGSTVTGLVRGLAGTSDIAHSIGAIVEFVPDVTWADAINDTFTVAHNADGTHKLNTFSNLNAPEGFLINGRISVTVASNNLTVAIKGLDGNDPSATNPVYVRIANTVRTISAALSISANAGTNWFNAGSTELAAKEIDYFAYIGYNATDGVVLGFARIPYASLYSDFNTTTTNEKYARISTITNATSGDSYVNIGRFAATLSAGAGYTWSVPTFNTSNLIQRPIYETRTLSYTPVWTAQSVNPSLGNGVLTGKYILRGATMFINVTLIPNSTTTFGTGGWSFSTTMISTQGQLNGQIGGTGYAWNGTNYSLNATANYIFGTGNFGEVIAMNANSIIAANTPFNWAANGTNYCSFGIVYLVV